MGICATCGLPQEICSCQELSKDTQKIKVTVERVRYKKFMTILEGFDQTINLEDLARDLKQVFACGGTAKNGRIELQGDHKSRIKKVLINKGFKEAQIDVY